MSYKKSYTKNKPLFEDTIAMLGLAGALEMIADMGIPVKQPKVKQVIFNPPATIVNWTDGTKTVAMCSPEDKFNEEFGFAMACAKKLVRPYVPISRKTKGMVWNPTLQAWYGVFGDTLRTKTCNECNGGNPKGCDSINTLQLLIPPAYHFEEDITWCRIHYDWNRHDTTFRDFQWFGHHSDIVYTHGGDYYDNTCDSVYVTDMGMFGTPSTVVFCSGHNQDVIQFYSNYTVRSTERITDGRRNGRVMFYYPNGNPQTEAYFVDGKEEGDYTVYYENGIPYYRGTYTGGQRTGVWEFYDREGNLADTNDFSARN